MQAIHEDQKNSRLGTAVASKDGEPLLAIPLKKSRLYLVTAYCLYLTDHQIYLATALLNNIK